MKTWLNRPVPYKSVLLSYGVSALLGIGGIALFFILRAEGKDRRDQACLVDEKKQREKVNQLGDTYRFLLAQKAAGEDNTVLYQFIVAALPQQERNAQVDEAAPFCDEPGVGLPEPDPKIPERPAALK